MYTMAPDALKHIIPYQIGMAVLGEVIDKHVDK